MSGEQINLNQGTAFRSCHNQSVWSTKQRAFWMHKVSLQREHAAALLGIKIDEQMNQIFTWVLRKQYQQKQLRSVKANLLLLPGCRTALRC